MSVNLLDALTSRSRAVVLTAAAVGLTSLFATGAVAAASQPTRQKPTIVLVHGAWADASSWRTHLPAHRALRQYCHRFHRT